MRTSLRTPLLLALAAALLVPVAGPGCAADEPQAPPPAARVVREAQPPEPAPLSPNREARKLDRQGELLESTSELFGFRLPVGVERVSQSTGQAVLTIDTKLDRLSRFYLSRGYDVTEGKGGFTVRHSKRTLADLPNAAAVAEARLYLRHGFGRAKELRFFNETGEGTEAPPPEPPKLLDPDGPLPPGVTPEVVRARNERIRRWMEAHPGQPLEY